MVEIIEADEFVVDKGYDSNFIRNTLEERGIKSTIPYRRNRKVIKEINTENYKERNKIERLFLKLKKFRRFAFRVEKRSENFFCITLITCICLFIGL